jgi:hypothetical protein
MTVAGTTISKGMLDGKVIVPQAIQYSRMIFIKGYLQYLRADYEKFTTQIEYEVTPKPLQEILTPYCLAITNLIKTYPIKKDGKVSANGKLLSKKLYTVMMNFDSTYSGYKELNKAKKGLAVSKKVHQIICELNSGVNWFLNQHAMIITSERVQTWLPQNPTKQELEDFIREEAPKLMKSISNRPKDFEARSFFKKTNEEYQKKLTTTRIIPYKLFESEISRRNSTNPNLKPITVSNKTYTRFRSELRNGKLFHLA